MPLSDLDYLTSLSLSPPHPNSNSNSNSNPNAPTEPPESDVQPPLDLNDLNVLSLLKEMDEADLAADGLENRLDSLLVQLDLLLGGLEGGAETDEVEVDGTEEKEGGTKGADGEKEMKEEKGEKREKGEKAAQSEKKTGINLLG